MYVMYVLICHSCISPSISPVASVNIVLVVYRHCLAICDEVAAVLHDSSSDLPEVT